MLYGKFWMIYGVILSYMVRSYRYMGYYYLVHYTLAIDSFVLCCHSLIAEIAHSKNGEIVEKKMQ